MLDQVATDFSADNPDLLTLESFLRRKNGKAPPPSPPHPARYEICQGIPFKRYKFVKSMEEMNRALDSAKPGDLIEVKSGVYYQGSGPGASSLIPPSLSVEERGSAISPRIDPRNKKKPPIKSLLGAQMGAADLGDLGDMDAEDGIDGPKPPLEGPRETDGEELVDMSFAELYDVYSQMLDDHLQDLYDEELAEAAPLPAPAAASDKPRPEKLRPDKPRPSNKKPGSKSPEKPSKGQADAGETPDTRPGVDIISLPEIETDEDRFESYYDEDEAEEVPGDVARPPSAAPKPNAPKPVRGSWVAPSGTIDNVHGTGEDPITLCGPKSAVFDGSNGDRGLAAAALRVVRSSNVKVVGFTLQNALKGLDIQQTNSSIFSNVSTRYTLQEGIRIRYNSTFNLVFGCNITFTGRLWAGIGEGIYIGTSTRNSIAAGLPEDRSNFNNITHTTFGDGIPAENIDLKEYTSGGVIANNTFNGTGIAGLNGAIAWVAVKGTNYTIANNTGSGTIPGGQGIRVLQVLLADNEHNSVMDNTCTDFEKGSYCVFIDARAKNTIVDCDNRRLASANSTSNKRTCNCNIDATCQSGDSTYMTIKSVRDAGPPKIRASYILSIIIRRCPEGPRRRGPMGVPPRLGLMVGRETPPTKLIKFKSTTLPRQRRRPFSLSATCMPRWAPTRHGRPSRGDQGHPRRRRGAAGLPSPGAVHLRYHGNLRA